MNIDKTKILEYVIRETESEIDKLKAELAHAKHAKLEAPGRMQSRYDTMGIEAGWMADSLAKALGEKSAALIALQKFSLPTTPPRVAPGAIVGLGPRGGAVEDYYFILPAAGGASYKVQDSQLEVAVITPQAPIARSILGKTVGAEVPGPGLRPSSRTILFLQ